MNLLNGFFSEWFFGPWFNYDTDNVLLACVDTNNDYVKIMASLFLILVVCLSIFYKFYDPIKKSRLKWIITILLIAVLCYSTCDQILWANTCILIQMGNYDGNGIDPINFVRQINFITMVYSIIISIILSLLVFRKISNNNRNNPF